MWNNSSDVFAQRLEFGDFGHGDESANLWGIAGNLELANAVVADDGMSVWAVLVGDEDIPRVRGIVEQDNGVGARWRSWLAARRLMVEQEIQLSEGEK